MRHTRRDLLTLTAGAAAGIAASPLPWRLIGDVSIWTQNWWLIPRPPRGEVASRYTACTLCPSGCPVRARCVNGQPVSLWGASGAICPAGLCGHHLPYHPSRLKQAQPAGEDAALKAAQTAIDAIRSRNSSGLVAVFDPRPGRTATLVYRRLLAKLPNGVCLTPDTAEGATLRSVESVLQRPRPLGYDFDRARTVISFSTPLMDGWGAPARMLSPERSFKLIQVDPRYSPTAMVADEWISIVPGTEAVLAAALAEAIMLIESPAIDSAARATGLSHERIVELAKRLREEGPAIAIADGDPAVAPLPAEARRAAAILNARLGSIGRPGAIVPRRPVPVPKEWNALSAERALEEIPDGAISVLFVDDSSPAAPIPWKLLESKLARENPLVIAGSWSRQAEGHASHVLPVPVFPEVFDDTPPPAEWPTAVYSVAPPLQPRPAGAIALAEFLGRVAGAEVDLEQAMKERVAAIHAAGRGEVEIFTGGRKNISEFASADELWAAFTAGARWFDSPCDDKLQIVTLDWTPPAPPRQNSDSLTLLSQGWRGAEVSPIMGKLWIESDLRPRADVVAVNPRTAERLNLHEGQRVRLETDRGAVVATVAIDPSARPEALQIGGAQKFLALSQTAAGSASLPQVRVVRA